MATEAFDDDLSRFEAQGGMPLPPSEDQGFVECDGARIWYSAYGSGAPVVLLHGGQGHGGNFGAQVPALVDAGYRAILIDSRGHGRSTRDERPYSYDLMAEDTLAVMDALGVDRAAFIGWSDGAVISLAIGMRAPERTAGVFFFACNVNDAGTKEFVYTEILGRCMARHIKDYAELSSTPDDFKGFADAVQLMQSTQPNYSDEQLAAVTVPFLSVLGRNDEFIKVEHAEYLARVIPNAKLLILEDVTHFAPIQRPALFNSAVLGFLKEIGLRRAS